jgi:hypothetical protein
MFIVYWARAGAGIEVAVGVGAGVDIGGTGVDTGGTGVSVERIVGIESGVGVEQELSREISKTQSTKR